MMPAFIHFWISFLFSLPSPKVHTFYKFVFVREEIGSHWRIYIKLCSNLPFKEIFLYFSSKFPFKDKTICFSANIFPSCACVYIFSLSPSVYVFWKIYICNDFQWFIRKIICVIILLYIFSLSVLLFQNLWSIKLTLNELMKQYWLTKLW